MTYLISYCFIRGGGFLLLEGPDHFDVEGEFRRWRKAIEEKCGPEPNIVCYGSHQQWLLTYMATLREYQAEYNSAMDFPSLFIEHLIQRCGFSRREYKDVRLL